MLLIPKINWHKGIILFPKLSLFLVLVYILFYSQLINIANYSFLSYDANGILRQSILFELVRYSRLLILFLIVPFLFIQKPYLKQLKYWLFVNYDIFILIGIMFLGIANALNKQEAFFYTIWQLGSLLSVLLFIFLLIRYQDAKNTLFFILRFLFWSNALVLPLLFINLDTFGDSWTFKMAYTSKGAAYPYCLLSMLLAIYSSHLLCGKSIFAFKRDVLITSVELLLIISILFFTFFSARRTPLFIMAILSFFYLFHIVGRYYWKKVLLLGILTIILVGSIPYLVDLMETYKYEYSILNKLESLNSAVSGSKEDPSYSERKHIWQLYYQVFQHNPIIGTGASNSQNFSTALYPGHSQSGYSVHNMYVGITVEHGLLGLICFLLILIRGWWTMFKKVPIKHYINFWIFLIGPVLIINWNEYNLIPGQMFYWTTILILLLPRIYLLNGKR
ncbi:MAG: O-antigen ligase family protein [Bacteroidota bacterium]|nr:O-antigen ligase family protein [Bacteroidota bacterium]